jgi:hypothetical protein
MVLMPCGRCCCLAGSPFDVLGNTTSVEVDLVQDTDHNYSFYGTISNPSSTMSGTARLQPLTGTYSLSLVDTNRWEYEDSNVFISFYRAAGSSPYQSLIVVPKVNFSGSIATASGTISKTAIGATGGQVVRDCDSTNQNRYSSNSWERWLGGSIWASAAINDVVSTDGIARQFGMFAKQMASFYMEKGRVGSFPTDCRLPFQVTARSGLTAQRAWNVTWTQSSNSFPSAYSHDYGVLSDSAIFYYFDYTFTVSACRLIYQSQTVSHMSNLADVCNGFSYT